VNLFTGFIILEASTSPDKAADQRALQSQPACGEAAPRCFAGTTAVPNLPSAGTAPLPQRGAGFNRVCQAGQGKKQVPLFLCFYLSFSYQTPNHAVL